MDRQFVATEVKPTALDLLGACVSDDYAEKLWDFIGEDVIEDVWECSGIQSGTMFSDTDVRYAIGRALFDRVESLDAFECFGRGGV